MNFQRFGLARTTEARLPQQVQRKGLASSAATVLRCQICPTETLYLEQWGREGEESFRYKMFTSHSR